MRRHILDIANLQKSFGSKKVIKNVNLKVAAGDIFGFLGPNGAGKTTIIRMILGLVYPDQGTININGYNIKKQFEKAIAGVGAIVETPKFYPYLSGYQNVALIANLHKSINKGKVQEVLELVGLSDRAREKVNTYSLGMKQRLGIARALVTNPNLIFLDEPMNGLDPQGMLEVRQLVKNLAETKGITFFITSHLLSEIEQLCNEVAILKEGQILTQGQVGNLLLKDTEVVEVHTEKILEAQIVLQGFSYIKNIHQFEDKLSLEIEKGYSGQLNTLLISQNIEVNYLIPKNDSLEDYFLNLTQGEK